MAGLDDITVLLFSFFGFFGDGDSFAENIDGEREKFCFSGSRYFFF